MEMDRREFVAKSLIAAGAFLAAPPLLQRIAAAAEEIAPPPGARAPILVVLQMLGGNDGLNTVIPYNDPDYANVRPQLGIAQSDVLTLQNGAALHPSLKSLMPIWNEGHLAVVQNVGYPNPILSHFESMDIWNTASVDRPKGDGWIGRYVADALQGNASSLSAVGIGVSLPPMLRTDAMAFTCLDGLKFFQLLRMKDDSMRDEQEHLLLDLYGSSDVGAYADLMKETVQSAFDTSALLQKVAQTYQTDAPYPKGRFGDSLKLAAQVLTSGLGTRVVHVSYGGFDTHSNQKNQQQRLLQDLGDGIAAFYHDLKSHGLDDRVVIMTASEFGRRVGQNASGGTDHGTASAHFVIGGAVKGGLYGGQPDLQNLDNGNLVFKIDFRSIYATVIREQMGFDPAAVLGESFPTLPLIAPSSGSASRGERARKSGLASREPATRKEILSGFVAQAARNLIPIDDD